MSYSPLERAALAGSTPNLSHLHHGYSQSQSNPVPADQHPRKLAIPGGSILSHSTSMATGLRSSSCAIEQVPRRPSMPSLIDPTSLSSDVGQMALQRSSASSSYMTPKRSSPPFSPTFSSPFEIGESHLTPISHTPSPFESSAISRRGSSAGLGVIAGSLGRTSSVLTRGAGLLKKDSTDKKDKNIKEKDERTKEKGKGKEVTIDVERDVNVGRSLQRPKLSLATVSSQYLPQHNPQVYSPVWAKSKVRRVKSSSSITGPVPEEEIPTSPASRWEVTAAPPVPKKKKGALVYGMEKIARTFDSARDFLDEK